MERQGSDGSGDGRSPMWARPLFWLAAAPLLLFLPLVLSLVESAIFGTDSVQDFFRAIGLHGALGKVYTPVLHLFGL